MTELSDAVNLNQVAVVSTDNWGDGPQSSKTCADNLGEAGASSPPGGLWVGKGNSGEGRRDLTQGWTACGLWEGWETATPAWAPSPALTWVISWVVISMACSCSLLSSRVGLFKCWSWRLANSFIFCLIRPTSYCIYAKETTRTALMPARHRSASETIGYTLDYMVLDSANLSHWCVGNF